MYDARAADLFACGVVGYVLATGTYPWQSTATDCKASFSSFQFGRSTSVRVSKVLLWVEGGFGA